jgi:syntaxin 5
LKYYASVTSNRWLMLKIFGVLIIFVSTRRAEEWE